jgi:tetratricopeptide (TPR) repeat protein
MRNVWSVLYDFCFSKIGVVVDSSGFALKPFTPQEAAAFLGITPALLFAYTLYAPKTHLKHEVRLPCAQVAGSLHFRKSDLEEFDAYLHQPWSESGDDRPKIPTFIAEYLKVECAGQCARCGKGYKLENAHIDDYAVSRSHHHHNIIRLCSQCHDEFGSGRLLLRAEIDRLKQSLIAKIREGIQRNGNEWPGGIGRVPNPSTSFVGRDSELVAIATALRQQRTISIEGVGGVGKTQLLLNALQRQPDGRTTLWVDLEAYRTSLDLQLGLTSALSGLGEPLLLQQLDQQLDKLKARLIFDGVERMGPAQADGLEDFFKHLVARTNETQLIFTSQTELKGFEISARIPLGPLPRLASESILASAIPLTDPYDHGTSSDLNWLVDFCAGHALSLQITAGLIQHFKSASIVAARVREKGAAALQQPGRHTQSTETSLRACLLVSYQALTEEERKLLWLASECPAGCPVAHLDSSAFGLLDIEAGVASLRCWHLIEVRPDLWHQRRLHVLSPIRSFVTTEWANTNQQSVNELRLRLSKALTIQAMILNERYLDGGDVQWGILRFRYEFPNYLRFLDWAASCTDLPKDYLEMVGAMANSLMVYCFVAGHFERGAKIMQLGAEAAKKLGMNAAASDLMLKMMTLAERAHQSDIMEHAARELAALSAQSSDPYVSANLEMANANLDLMRGRVDEAERHSEAAISLYDRAIRERTDDSNQHEGFENADETRIERVRDARGRLALAYKSRGFAFEKRKQPAKAIQFYEKALSLAHETSDGVNEGAILHGIANCAADLGDFSKAVYSYLAAAKHFETIGMSEFLSNSLSDMAYVLNSWTPQVPITSLVTEGILARGLIDASIQTAADFAPSEDPGIHQRRMATIRKLIGMISLVSFTTHTQLLTDWAHGIEDNVLGPALEQIERGKRNKDDRFPLLYLNLSLALATSISSVTWTNGKTRKPTIGEIEQLTFLCFQFCDWGWEAFHLYEWLATYLVRHRGLANVSPDTLRFAAENAAEFGLPFNLPGVDH